MASRPTRTPLLIALALATVALAPFATAQENGQSEGCAVTPGGWGAPPSGENNGALLHEHFDHIFPSGLSVGPYDFETAQEVTDTLPAHGDPLLNHAVALAINLAFGAAGRLDGTLEGVEVIGGPYNGTTAEDMLAHAETALGDTERSTSKYSSLISALTGLNQEEYGCDGDTPPPCVDDRQTPEDECNPEEPPCVDDVETPEDECNPEEPPCVDDMQTPEDECNPEEPPCVDDMTTPEDECDETEIPFFPGFTSLALGSLGALAVVGMILRRRT